MPNAVLHILLPLIIVALFKDRYDKNHKKPLPLHYALIAGIAGLLPDIDVAVFWILHFFGFTYATVHRTFAHTIFVPLIFLILFFVFKKIKVKEVRKRKIKLNIVFLMIALGSLIHLILDAIFVGVIAPFYPLSLATYGLDLVSYFPEPLDRLFIPSLEAALLVIWLIYLELKHKISDFI